MQAETQKVRGRQREAARGSDDSVSAAEDIALRDTTRGPREIGFQSGRRASPNTSEAKTFLKNGGSVCQEMTRQVNTAAHNMTDQPQ